MFDPKGRYLYFLSNRDFSLTFSGYEFNYVYADPTRVYVGVLSKAGPALFLPQSDEEPRGRTRRCARCRPARSRRRAGSRRTCRSRRRPIRRARARRNRRNRRRTPNARDGISVSE